MNINYSKQYLDKDDYISVLKSQKNQFLTQGPKFLNLRKKFQIMWVLNMQLQYLVVRGLALL